jgi:hypothetical protein
VLSPALPPPGSAAWPGAPTERERDMREYLAWEVDLVNQIARDGDCRFRLAPAAA